MRLNRVMLILVSVGLIGIAAAPASDLQEPTSLADYLAKLHPVGNELRGAEWGWDLTAYPNFVGAYRIGSQTLVMAAATLDKQLIINPTAKTVLVLDKLHSDRFAKLAKDYQLPYPLSHPDSPANFKEVGSPGAGFSCGPPWSNYYDYTKGPNGLSRSFYVVILLPHPKRNPYEVCQIGNINSLKTVSSNLEEGSPLCYALPDSTVLMFVESRGYLLRLDQNLNQRSTINGKVFVVDAETINSRLNSGVAGDPAFRFGVFRQALISCRKEAKNFCL